MYKHAEHHVSALGETGPLQVCGVACVCVCVCGFPPCFGWSFAWSSQLASFIHRIDVPIVSLTVLIFNEIQTYVHIMPHTIKSCVG